MTNEINSPIGSSNFTVIVQDHETGGWYTYPHWEVLDSDRADTICADIVKATDMIGHGLLAVYVKPLSE